MERAEVQSKVIDLVLISFVALFFEILFIRWVPSCAQVMAYFTNAILISCFLGLGLGCLLADAKVDLMRLFPLMILAYVALLMGFSHMPLDVISITKSEHFLGQSVGTVHPLLIAVTIFTLNTAILIPIGQRLGLALRSFRPLVSYSINIAGSIAGVALFACLSYGMTPPFKWFLCGLIPCAWFFRSSWKMLLFQALPSTLVVMLVLQTSPASYWSPYYKIDLSFAYEAGHHEKGPMSYGVSVNDTFHQGMYDFSQEGIARFPSLQQKKDVYEYPYELVHPQSVLIIGAGSGNDASAALRMGAGDVVAIEIDPFIASLGYSLHAEQPYRSDKVKVVVNDARAAVENLDRKFDLVTFGYLDAHRVFSQFSSVRLDNFIYTEGSFRAIKERLNSNGLLSLTFFAFRPWVPEKLYAGLANVFGDDLVAVRTATYAPDDTVVFLAGPAVRGLKNIESPGFRIDNRFKRGGLSTTDDWPFLYLLKRGIPTHYLLGVGYIVLAAFFSIFLTGLSPFGKFDPHFFFLGAGFMLLETVSITRFALLFGSTWTVNVAVIIAILVMILLSTLYVERGGRLNVHVVYGLLAAALLVNLMIEPKAYLAFGRTGGILLASAVLSLPLLFAALIFAFSFRQVQDVTNVFAYNLFGAIIGGVCEYASMATGFRFLYVLAIVMYALSLAGTRRQGMAPGS